MVILENIDIDKISNRFKFGISNRASSWLVYLLVMLLLKTGVIGSGGRWINRRKYSEKNITTPHFSPIYDKWAVLSVLMENLLNHIF